MISFAWARFRSSRSVIFSMIEALVRGRGLLLIRMATACYQVSINMKIEF